MSIGSKSFHLQYLKVVVFHAKNEHTQKGFFLFCEYWHNDEQTKIGTIVKKQPSICWDIETIQL